VSTFRWGGLCIEEHKMLNITNSTLHIALVIDIPVVFSCALAQQTLIPTANCSQPGIDAQVLRTLLTFMKVSSYVLHPYWPEDEGMIA
jgi:hypothetical protein